MPTDDQIQILIPRAGDAGYGNILTREYFITIFVRNQSYFTAVQLLDIHYAPNWAKVQAAVYQSGVEQQRYSGAGGEINMQVVEITEMEQVLISIANFSIDTDVRFTLHFRGWQLGDQ